jgi:hypothetical protein
MHRSILRRAAVGCLAALTLLPVGCAAPDVEVEAEMPTRSTYPDWVRVVPEATDEASYFVGSVALARDVEGAIEAAETDAFDQMREAQRRHFVDLFDRAAKDAGIETTSRERLELRTNVTDEIADDLAPATERMDAYYRHCEGEEGKQRGAVCEAFVLVRLDHVERDRISSETLASIGQRKQQDGETNLAALIEWALRNQ